MRPARFLLAGHGLGARLSRFALALAARRVDPLEERAARVVEREEVDEADVLEHLGGAVPRERRRGRERTGAPARRRRPCRAARPSPQFAPTTARRREDARSTARRRRRRRGRPRARRAHARTTRCRRAARRARLRRRFPTPSPERLDRGGADVRIGVPGELDQRRVASSGYGPSNVAPQKRTAGVPVAQERDEPLARQRARAARARPRSASAGRSRAAARRGGCRSPSRHRGRRACGSRRRRSSGPDRRARRRISRGTAG